MTFRRSRLARTGLADGAVPIGCSGDGVAGACRAEPLDRRQRPFGHRGASRACDTRARPPPPAVATPAAGDAIQIEWTAILRRGITGCAPVGARARRRPCAEFMAPARWEKRLRRTRKLHRIGAILVITNAFLIKNARIAKSVQEMLCSSFDGSGYRPGCTNRFPTLYESLPYAFIGAGLILLSAFSGAFALLAGSLLVLRGAWVWLVRRSHRSDHSVGFTPRTGARRRPRGRTAAKGVSRPTHASARSYYNDQG